MSAEIVHIRVRADAFDLTGKRFGKLIALAPVGRKKYGLMWRCRCDCGREKDILSTSLTRKTGRPSRSCGCANINAGTGKPNGPWNEGKSYAILGGEHCYKTRHGWARAATQHYGNKCEHCGWAKARCDVHHREHKARGGLHTLANAIVLCPNCHRLQHEMERVK